MQQTRLESLQKSIRILADGIGELLTDAFHYLALFTIGGAIVWSALVAFQDMFTRGQVSIADILLLFIYLELGAMVGIYFKTNAMPVRCLIYIAITALSRLLISDIQAHHEPDLGILLAAGAIFLLALSTRFIRQPSGRP